jgi:hypothetical protein
MAGERFGRWTVKEHAGSRDGALWRAACDCGTERVVSGSSLRNGESQSCGCLGREKAAERNRARPKVVHAPLTAERVRELLTYDPWDGDLIWLVDRPPSVKAGDIAGSVNKVGYRAITVDGQRSLVHRIIWLLMTGRWPHPTVDHRDLDRLNNRWSNLREATQSEQVANGRARVNNKIGLKGVTKRRDYKTDKPYEAHITKNGRTIRLGRFPTARSAHRAYKIAALRRFGGFARAV